jgi:hypothetical protein
MNLRAVRLLLRAGLVSALGGRQRQPGCPAHYDSFLGGKHVLETVGIDHLLALWGRHSSQVTDRCADHAPPIRWELLHLPENLTCLLFLIGSQVLPRFHAIQHALLLLRRQV